MYPCITILWISRTYLFYKQNVCAWIHTWCKKYGESKERV